MRARIGVLASGSGSNLQAILDATLSGELKAEVCVVLSNNSSARALERARVAGVPVRHLSSKTHPLKCDLDAAILDALLARNVNWVVLAGYMKKLGPAVLSAFPDRILNLHPALLPRHGGSGMFGLNVHRAVLASGDLVTGATVHFVDEEYDRGPIVAQEEVPVLLDDTPELLSERVLAVEHALIVRVLVELTA
jgi:phosphoribosylglycinamide formyltransferase-1